jgi:hypothetical protein
MAKPKKGLIQSRRIGDIIIALPIAKHFSDNGFEVYWPIDERYIPSFRDAAPYVNFLPLEADAQELYLYEHALAALRRMGCDDVHVLYNALRGHERVVDAGLASFLSFDRYKYAVCGVPFREKWNLSIVRDRAREQALYDRLVEKPRYVVCHFESREFRFKSEMQAPPDLQVIHIHEASDRVFDWITILERAEMLMMIDSCFANLVEQLNLPVRKLFIQRSPVGFSPVLINDWSFLR